MKISAGDPEIMWWSSDKKRMVVEELSLYELTHIDEKGVHHYKLIGITDSVDQAENYLNNDISTYITVTADTTTRSITDED